MLELKGSIFNREQTLTNVLKALAIFWRMENYRRFITLAETT
jgi:hypothetical protein